MKNPVAGISQSQSKPAWIDQVKVAAKSAA